MLSIAVATDPTASGRLEVEVQLDLAKAQREMYWKALEAFHITTTGGKIKGSWALGASGIRGLNAASTVPLSYL